MTAESADDLMTSGEVAALFRVTPKTVTRWAADGRLASILTPGGHRRFRRGVVQELLRGQGGEPGDGEPGDGEPGGGEDDA